MIYNCTIYTINDIRVETIEGDWKVLRSFLQWCKNEGANTVRVVRQSGDRAGITHKVYFKQTLRVQGMQRLVKYRRFVDRLGREGIEVDVKDANKAWEEEEQHRRELNNIYRVSTHDPVILNEPDFNIRPSDIGR